MEKRKVAGIGEVLWDVLPAGRRMGGAPLNFAFHVQQNGCEACMVSAVGRDEAGDELLRQIAALGISTDYIERSDYPTGTVNVMLRGDGIPIYDIVEDVAWDHIHFDERMQTVARTLDAVCWGTLAQRSPESAATILKFIGATRGTCLKVFDINLRQHYYNDEVIRRSLALADVLKINDEELPVVASILGLTGDVTNQIQGLLAALDLRYVVYTMGSRGSIVVGSEGEYSRMEVPVVTVADTVGAGDSFTATFVAGLLRGLPMETAHAHANRIAAYVTTQHGATPVIPADLLSL